MRLEEKMTSGTLANESNELIVKQADSSYVGYTFGAYMALVIAATLGVKIYRHFRRRE